MEFYHAEYIDVAKEWACDQLICGYASKYSIGRTGLKILDLNSKDATSSIVSLRSYKIAKGQSKRTSKKAWTTSFAISLLMSKTSM